MNNIWKRSLSLLLAVVMIIGVLPMSVFAEEIAQAQVAEVQEMIDALPEELPVEEGETQEEYEARIEELHLQLVEIDTAAGKLTEEQFAELNIDKFIIARDIVDGYYYGDIPMAIADGTEADPYIIEIQMDTINGSDLLTKVKEFGGSSNRHYYANGTKFTTLGFGYVGDDTVTFEPGIYLIQGESSSWSWPSGNTYTTKDLFYVEIKKLAAEDAIVSLKEGVAGSTVSVYVNFFYGLADEEQNFVAKVVEAACVTTEDYDPSKMVLNGYIKSLGIGWTGYATAMSLKEADQTEDAQLVYDGTVIGEFKILFKESRPTVNIINVVGPQETLEYVDKPSDAGVADVMENTTFDLSSDVASKDAVTFSAANYHFGGLGLGTNIEEGASAGITFTLTLEDTAEYIGSSATVTANIRNITDVNGNGIHDGDEPQYTINWVNGEETVKSVNSVSGVSVAYDGTEPTKASDGSYNYYFAGWDIDGDGAVDVELAGDITVSETNITAVAVFTAKELYTVVYTDGLGNTLLSEKVEVGQNTPTITDPTREYYTFAGWDPEFSATVTANATYTATWTADLDVNGNNIADQEESFTISWDIDGDGVVDKTTTVAWGEDPVPETPATLEDKSFAGWSPVLATVTNDATYTATFSDDIVYEVKFVVDGKDYDVQYVNVTKNEKVATPEDPDKEYAVFGGWYPEILPTPVEDTVYTAIWLADENNNNVADENETATIKVTVEGPGSVTLAGEYATLTDNEDGSYTVLYDSTVENGDVITVTATPTDTVNTDGSVDYLVSAPASVTVAAGQTAAVEAVFATESMSINKSGAVYINGYATEYFNKLDGLKTKVLDAAFGAGNYNADDYNVYMITLTGNHDLDSTSATLLMLGSFNVGDTQGFTIETKSAPVVSDTFSAKVTESRPATEIVASQEEITFAAKTEPENVLEEVAKLFSISSVDAVTGVKTTVMFDVADVSWSPAYAWPGDSLTTTHTVTLQLSATAERLGSNEATVTVTLTDTTILYTVTYLDGYNAENNVVASYTIPELEANQQPADPSRTYYTFTGWTPDVEDTIPEGVEGGENTLTYTATWTADLDDNANGLADQEELYTVVYVLDNGEDAISYTGLVWGAETPSVDNPTREGYNFKGWNPAIVSEISAPAEGNTITYNAQWTQNHAVIFMNKGEQYATDEVEEGMLLTEPEAPVWDEDHDFLGWYNGDEKYDFSAPVTASLTLEAKWRTDYNRNDLEDADEEHFTVIYVVDGYEEIHENILIGMPTPSKADPLKPYYIFNGWAPEVAETVTADVTYVAQWLSDANSNKVDDALETITLTVEGEGTVTLSGTTEGAVEGTYLYDSTGSKTIAVKASPVVSLLGVSSSYVSGIAVDGTAAQLSYNTYYSVDYSFTAEGSQTVSVVFAPIAFEYNETRVMNYYVGMENVSNETVYNTIVASPELPGDFTITYKAREAMSQTVQLSSLGLNETVLEVLALMNMDSITIDMPAMWQDVNVETSEGLIEDAVSLDQAVAQYLTADKINGLWDLYKATAEANGGLIAGAEAGYAAVQGEIDAIIANIKNAAMYYQAHNFGYNATDAETVTEEIKITYKNEAYYIEGESTIDLKDLRAPSYVKGSNENGLYSVTYCDYTDEELVAFIGAYVENSEGEKIEGAVLTAIDITDPYTYEGKYVSDTAYELTFKFAGNEDYKPSEGTFYITVTKASAEIDIPNVMVNYGEEYTMLDPSYVTLGNRFGDPSELTESMIQFVIGLDIADVDLNEDGVTGLNSRVQLILPEDLQSMLDGILAATGANVEEGVELSLAELLTYLEPIQDSSLTVLKQALEALQGITETGDVKIVLGGALPKDTGAYLYGAVSTSSNYETAFDVAYIVIKPAATQVHLDWNYTDTNGIFSWELLQYVDMGASAFNEAEFATKNEDATALVNNVLFGLDENGQLVTRLVAPGQDLMEGLTNGAYTQLAFIAEFGNEFYYAVPIVRAFVIVPNIANVELVDAEGNALDSFTYTYDKAPKELYVTLDGEVIEHEITYAGLQSNTNTYGPTAQAPTHAGAYGALVVYVEKNENGSVTALGADAAALLIEPAESTISVTGGTFEYDGQPHGVTVEATQADVTIISAYLDYTSNEEGLNLEDATVVINVDLPQWLDAYLAANHPHASANGLNKADLLRKLDEYKTELLELGITEEMLTSITDLLNNIPADVHVYFNEVASYTNPGVYAYVGIVTDSDYMPSYDTGLVVIQKKGLVLDMMDTTVTYNGEGQFIDVYCEPVTDYVTIIVDRENNIGNIILEDDLSELLAIVGESLNVDIPESVDVATMQAKIREYLAEIEANEELPAELAEALTKAYEFLDKLPQTGTVYINGEWLPTDVGEYEFYGASYSATYATNLTEGTLTIVPINVDVILENAQKVYGSEDPDPVYTLKYYDHEGNELTVFESDVEVVITREEGEDVGTYLYTADVTIASENYKLVNVTEDAYLEITPAELIITVDGQSKVYGDADPELSYTMDSLVNGDTEADVNFSISREKGEDVGTYAITATAESENYNITIDNNVLTITKKNLTITVDEKTKVYGDADPELTYTVDGLANGDTEADVNFSISREKGEDVGTYAITAAAESENYNITIDNNVLTITKKAVTVTADNKSKVYGEADPELSATVEGLVEGDELNVSLVRAEGENVGTYAITAYAEDANYDITFVAGVLTITKKALTVKLDAQTKVYGETDPELTYIVDGLANDDTEDALNITASREEGEDVGEYAITAEVQSDNYEVEIVEAKLSITKKALTVTLDAQTKVYGDADPELTYTVDGLANGDTEDALNITASREEGEDVGVYALTATVGNSNYEATVNDGTMTIEKATITVIVESDTIIVGEELPEVVYTLRCDGTIDEEALNLSVVWEVKTVGDTIVHGEYEPKATYTASDNYDLVVVGTADSTVPGGYKTPRLVVSIGDDYVCWNMLTGEYYSDLSDALEEADNADIETVQMLKDYTEKYVIIAPGTTLDLADCTVTASFVIGLNGSYLIGNFSTGEGSDCGKLIVAEDNFSLSEECKYIGSVGILPVYNPDGYFEFARFMVSTTGTNRGLTIDEENQTIYFQFMINTSTFVREKLLADGVSDNKLTFVVRLEWQTAEGTAYQNFVYSDELIEKVYNNSGLDFFLKLTNYDELNIDIATLTVKGMVISSSDAASLGTTHRAG